MTEARVVNKYCISATYDIPKRIYKVIKTGSFMRIDRRTFKTLVEAESKIPEWFSRGSNHREEDGTVARDVLEEGVKYIEASSLDDLLKIIGNDNLPIIISESNYQGISLEIEIYNGYRE